MTPTQRALAILAEEPAPLRHLRAWIDKPTPDHGWGVNRPAGRDLVAYVDTLAARIRELESAEAEPEDRAGSYVLRRRSEDGRRGYFDGLRAALRLVQGSSNMEDACESLRLSADAARELYLIAPMPAGSEVPPRGTEREGKPPAQDDKRTAPADSVVASESRIYPCAECGVMRTKSEGGTVFTVCDTCWNKAYGKKPPPAVVEVSAHGEPPCLACAGLACPECSGTGNVLADLGCLACGGSGKLEDAQPPSEAEGSKDTTSTTPPEHTPECVAKREPFGSVCVCNYVQRRHAYDLCYRAGLSHASRELAEKEARIAELESVVRDALSDFFEESSDWTKRGCALLCRTMPVTLGEIRAQLNTAHESREAAEAKLKAWETVVLRASRYKTRETDSDLIVAYEAIPEELRPKEKSDGKTE